jgi:hypothetical protein
MECWQSLAMFLRAATDKIASRDVSTDSKAPTPKEQTRLGKAPMGVLPRSQLGLLGTLGREQPRTRVDSEPGIAVACTSRDGTSQCHGNDTSPGPGNAPACVVMPTPPPIVVAGGGNVSSCPSLDT